MLTKGCKLLRSTNLARTLKMNYSSISKGLIITNSDLKTLLNSKANKIKLLDCSWYMPGSHGPVIDDFIQVRIKGASLFEIDEVADKSIDLPHMIPSPEQFERQVSDMGISNEDRVIVYDKTGMYMASARAWWMFRLYGHENVSVLDKGFNPEDWSDNPHLLESGPVVTPPKSNFKSKFHPELVKYMGNMIENIDKKQFQVVDARSADRFYARVNEPRKNLFRGHIPGSKNVPFGLILKEKSFLERDQLLEVFKSSGIDPSKPIVTSCGSGVTGSVLSLGLATAGINTALYDGSWSEYGQESLKNPVEQQ
eukprot:TRINITY_DN3338_c0_g1_i1.p1 TRINITY_DN3338_c0_g1~~TRINITY_DN3338_c0_g1_i1.p1  ORF type:complete len:310 (+),score=54.46 TRINITY_DN3338_c0_g1_i1:232-1161(+)